MARQKLAGEQTYTWTAERIASSSIYLSTEADEVLDFAAQELALYLRRLVGGSLPVHRLPQLTPYSLTVSDAGAVVDVDKAQLDPASFVIAPGHTAITVRGGSARATLHGVYRFLERLGCAWSVHGRTQETVPSGRGKTFVLQQHTFLAQFLSLAYCSDIVTWHYTQPELLRERVGEDLDLVDWMAKTGATRFFFIRHPFDSQSTIHDLLHHFARRGIAVEIGGHILPLLLGRDRFRQYPEYFPAGHDGQRTELGNLCVSERGARELVAEQAVEFAAHAGPVAALHLWGADVLGAAWCRCRRCEKLTPQEQSLIVCNAVAERLEKEGVTVPIYYLAYHDTIEPRLRFEPHSSVWCEFAPRERCYGHSIGEPTCGTNRYYFDALQAYVEQFSRRVRVFEYYGDAILFFGCLVAIPHVIERDVAVYRKAGVQELSFLQFGRYSRWAYAPNFVAFAAATQGKKLDPMLEELWLQWHEQPAVLRKAFATLERLSEKLVRYGDIRLPPKRRLQRGELRVALARSLSCFADVAGELDSTGSATLGALASLVRYTQAVFEGVAHELEVGRQTPAVFARALKMLEFVDRTYKGVWGDIDLAVIHDLYAAAPLVPGWG